jgi:hypothetical protein
MPRSVSGKPTPPYTAFDEREGNGVDLALMGSPGSDKAYPRFLRDGDKLVKIGWSRSAGERYEHRAGKAVLHLVANAVLAAADGGQRFETGALGKLRLGRNQAPIPSYQLYLCLAWLRACGLIKQTGRSSYRITSKAHFLEQVEEKWNEAVQA